METSKQEISTMSPTIPTAPGHRPRDLTTEKLTASLPVASLVTIARKMNQPKASINRGKDNETVLHIHNGTL